MTRRTLKSGLARPELSPIHTRERLRPPDDPQTIHLALALGSYSESIAYQLLINSESFSLVLCLVLFFVWFGVDLYFESIHYHLIINSSSIDFGFGLFLFFGRFALDSYFESIHYHLIINSSSIDFGFGLVLFFVWFGVDSYSESIAYQLLINSESPKLASHCNSAGILLKFCWGLIPPFNALQALFYKDFQPSII